MKPTTDTVSRRSWLARAGFGLGAGVLAALPARAQALGERAGSRTDDDLSTQSLIGKRLRVIHPNQPVTMDYSTDRVNVEVDEQGLIRRISIG